MKGDRFVSVTPSLLGCPMGMEKTRYLVSVILLGVCTAVALTSCSPRCFVKKEERVDFYPTYIYRQANGNAAMPVIAWVHENEPSSALAKNIKRMINLTVMVPGMSENAAKLQKQVLPFLMQGRSGAGVPIELQEKKIKLSKSDADGLIQEDVVLPVTPPANSSAAWVTYQTAACRNDERRFQGQALVIPPSGLSIIVNLEAVHARPEAGWSRRFEQWSQQGAVFHYLSADPWQLYPQTSSELKTQRFPAGVLHMKALPLHSVRNSVDDLLEFLTSVGSTAVSYNAAAIASVFERFPERRFILIGDGQKGDAPLLATLARIHANQINHIWIMDSASRHADNYRDAFEGIPATLWTVVAKPSEIQ